MRVNPHYSADMVNLLDQAQQAENNSVQELSTGRRVNQPSDNPAAEAAMINENSRSGAVDQYTANSNSLTDVLNTGNSTLSSVVTLLQRAVSMTTETERVQKKERQLITSRSSIDVQARFCTSICFL